VVVAYWEKGAIHCWTVNMQDVAPSASRLSAFLSPDEQQRWSNYRLVSRQQQFLVSRGLLRVLLSQYLSCQPQEIRFQYSDNGKPAIEQVLPNPVRFNIAHSQDWILFAFSQDLELGVDIEVLTSDLNHGAIAQRFLREEEWLAYQQIDAELQQLAFYRIWSRKEALIKLWGDNLFQGLQLYPVPASPSVNQYQMVSRGKTVWLQDLDIDTSFTAALATFSEPSSIEFRDCIAEGGLP
jgi:4'-phosphopantetheinyl transferase